MLSVPFRLPWESSLYMRGEVLAFGTCDVHQVMKVLKENADCIQFFHNKVLKVFKL